MNKYRLPVYEEKIKEFDSQLTEIKKIHTKVSILRLITFLAFLLSWFWLFIHNQILGASFGLGLIVVFLVLLKKHKKIEDRKQYIENILKINLNEKKCCCGDFSIFNSGDEFINIEHAYSYDIDLFGKGSIFQYLNRTISFSGKQLLSNWLAETPLSKSKILENQKAIKELTPEIDFRQNFLTIGSIFESEEHEYKTIKTWLNRKPFFKFKLLTQVILYIIPFTTLLVLFGLIIGKISLGLFALVFVLNITIIGSKLKSFNRYNYILSKSHNNLKKIAELLKLIENKETKSKLLTNLKDQLYKDKQSANQQILKLTKTIDALDNRNNILIGVILNGLLLWDWQCIFRIEKWQLNHQTDFENWLNCISHFDALISLANLSYNNPDFCFPELSKSDFEFAATHIGHPLLNSDDRICNDFNINTEQRYAIITGANMAGKSTFLRAIATNLVLAGAGSVVCAERLLYTPLPLHSSMRNEDSLMKNESYFFAELKRLQKITNELNKGKKLFIILDEILRGTNSEDKRKGSIGFVKKITKKMAHGLVATHDLELARLAEQDPETFKALCFEVGYQNNKLIFDYKLQKGVTQNMNASFLMKQMNIIDE